MQEKQQYNNGGGGGKLSFFLEDFGQFKENQSGILKEID